MDDVPGNNRLPFNPEPSATLLLPIVSIMTILLIYILWCMRLINLPNPIAYIIDTWSPDDSIANVNKRGKSGMIDQVTVFSGSHSPGSERRISL